MTTTIDLDEIPGPRGLPLLGNAFDLDPRGPIESLMRLAEEYGPIYRITLPGGVRLDRLRTRPGRRAVRRHAVRQAGPAAAWPTSAEGAIGRRAVHRGHRMTRCGAGRTTS